MAGSRTSGLLWDVNAVLVNGAMLRVGFQNSLNEVWPRVVSLLSAVPADLPLLLCGHSLGGAMAMLTASRLAPRPIPGVVSARRQPRIGLALIGGNGGKSLPVCERRRHHRRGPAVTELTTWRFVHHNMDTAVRDPRLAAHSTGRYLARLTAGL